MSFDVFMDQINSVEKSKLRLCLKLIYSLMIGAVMSVLTKGRVKYYKTLGILAAVLTFYLSKLVQMKGQESINDYSS
jgi:hypothetical protein